MGEVATLGQRAVAELGGGGAATPISGAQFASPGAADRLRAERIDPAALRDPVLRSLATTDPVNPWGALLAWPDRQPDAASPRRARGTRLILADGAPVLFASSGGRKLTTFAASSSPGTSLDPDELLERAFAKLAEEPRVLGRRWLVVGSIDGVDALGSEHAAALERAGFVRDPKGYAAEPSPTPRSLDSGRSSRAT